GAVAEDDKTLAEVAAGLAAVADVDDHPAIVLALGREDDPAADRGLVGGAGEGGEDALGQWSAVGGGARPLRRHGTAHEDAGVARLLADARQAGIEQRREVEVAGLGGVAAGLEAGEIVELVDEIGDLGTGRLDVLGVFAVTLVGLARGVDKIGK